MNEEIPPVVEKGPLARAGVWLAAHRIASAWAWLLLAIAPVVVAAGMLNLTAAKGYSPGVFVDSLTYIESARCFAAGQGVSLDDAGAVRPMTHFPPLYPVALGIGIKFGQTAERTAALLHPFCLAVTLFFLGAVVLRLGGSIGLAAATQWFAAVSWELLSPHVLVLSEPLFMALAFAAIFFLTEHSRHDSLPHLLCAAVLLGLATMTRFAGLGIVIGAALYFAWSSRHRLRDTLIVSFGGALPLVIWLASHGGGGRYGVDRQIGPTAPALANVEVGTRTLGEFLVPMSWPANKIYLYAAILLGILIAGAYWRKTRLLGVIALGYLAFILLSLIFIDSGIVLDSRMLLPILPLALAIAAVVIAVALRSVKDLRNLTFIVCVLLVFSFDYANFRRGQVATELTFGVQHGFGYESADWTQSPVLSKVAAQPPDVLVISGSPDVVHYLTGKSGAVAPINARGFEDYSVRYVERRVRGRPAIFVDAPKLARQRGTATARDMEKWFDLNLIAEERDGKIYQVSLKSKSSGAEDGP